MDVQKILLMSTLTALLAVLVVKVYPNYPTGRLGVLFYYCTSSHEDRKELTATKVGLGELPLSEESTVNILIHGYTESSFRSWILNLTDALLAAQPGSVVILVDYWDLVTISRPYMMENTRKIADVTAQFIDLLVQERRIHLDKIHLMGFSLGGRICGLVGNRVKSGPLGRITEWSQRLSGLCIPCRGGSTHTVLLDRMESKAFQVINSPPLTNFVLPRIDASYPWLPPKTYDEFLDAGDAALVVHLRTSLIGSHSPPGHIDFIANGGLNQPGCSKWYYPYTAQQICNHYRSVWLMVEALNHGGSVFPACRCDSWESYTNLSCPCDTINHLVLVTNTSSHGTFHFSTNSVPPYSRSLEERS